MFVVTADQVGSRRRSDAVPAAIDLIRAEVPEQELTRSPQRTVGDELQVVTARATTALDIVLALTRDGGWSVGCGVGAVEDPMPQDSRAARGAAFIAARSAVEAAKKRQTRFAVAVEGATAPVNDEVQALVDLVISLRARRTDEGWVVFDLLRDGLSQRAVAERLGVTDQAVSARVRAAEIRLELAARPALARVLGHANGSGL